MIIKQISPAEIGLLTGLNRVFAEAFDEAETYLGAIPSDEYLKTLLAKECFIAVVAFDDGRVIGGLTAYELTKSEQERSEIYIYDLAVCSEYRRKGVATNLIKELKSIAKDRGAWVIFVQADRGDIPAIKLYESLGIKESVYHFDIPV
ncbi:AAC(3)-I family aminoglycoside N-acetyltransferase [Dehalogenimonas sp. 4OHTPN]|uniref:AAC(3)-I family aminoglycoside N-acetyltransferase n=1 Tax=Dehalogenimonas sp. 4OHTPN TaxID=3166643 RepID=A0AAU8GDE0_9CHLR